MGLTRRGYAFRIAFTMPYLNIQTNITVTAERREIVLKRSSALVSEVLGKPEKYVMVALKDEVPMLFGGSSDPVAFLELKSIGLSGGSTREYAREFCKFITETLDIPGERVYVKFNDAQRSMWGWNGDTFD